MSKYLSCRYEGKKKYVHHVVWFETHGYWPKMLDHIDGNTHNNDLSNLREVTFSQNSMNTATREDNTSGVKGVSWDKKRCKWQAYINVDQRSVRKRFVEFEQAVEWVTKMRKELHGAFIRIPK